MAKVRQFVLALTVLVLGAVPVFAAQGSDPSSDDLQATIAAQEATIAALESGSASTPVAMTPGEVIRVVHSSGLPEAAPGHVLDLVQFTIGPDSHLPPHTHPGMQVAYVYSGTLTYTVIEGEATYMRPSQDGADPETGTLTSGETGEFGPGSGLVEPAGMIHFGQNLGDEPVILFVATLFTVGEPASTVVEVATPAA